MSRSKHGRRRTELVELTSKPLKLQSALSSVLLLVGLVLLFSSVSPLGILLFAFGLVWNVITRIRIWWNHR
jgi:Zn-dependent membrane protease YugP